MSSKQYGTLDIGAHWGRLNEAIAGLVDYVPDDKLDWSPREDLFNFRGIFLHISLARHNWLADTVRDGEQTPDVLRDGQTPEGMKEQLRLSWRRLERFLADPAKLAAKYQEDTEVNGHWIAFHLLEHDVHHRADVLHYLASLEIEHPEVGTQ